MTNEDLKRIGELIDSRMRSLKDMVEIVRNKVDRQEMTVLNTAENVRTIRDQQSIMNGKLDEHGEALDQVKETLGSHTASLMRLESELPGYKDAWVTNRQRNEQLTKRVARIEKHLSLPTE